MVMGGNSCSKGSEIESRHSILPSRLIFHTYCRKFLLMFEKPKTDVKEAGMTHSKKQEVYLLLAVFS